MTAPISKKIPSGLKIDYVSCGPISCIQQGQILKAAAAILGWSVKIINTNGSPGQFKSAFDTVVQDKPAAVVFDAIPSSIFASEIPQLVANHTWISCAGCIPAFPQLNYNVAGAPVFIGSYDPQYAWVINDSHGKANVLAVTYASSQATLSAATDLVQKYAKYCPGCVVHNLPITVAQFANASSMIVSYLRAHPDTTYVTFQIDDLGAGLPAALQAAGIQVPGKVKLVGGSLNATALQYLLAGQLSVDSAYPEDETIFAELDALARHLVGDPVTQDPPLPTWLLTKANVPSNTYPFVVTLNLADKYKALWGL